MKHLVLIGFMASGKSTLASLLSPLLNLPIFSTDDWISTQTQKSIPEIFSLYGEEGFRVWERKTFEAILELKQTHIIDCGGGFVLRNHPKDLGRVYYLKVPLKEIQKRLENKEQRLVRPLANDISTLYSQREGIYQLNASKVIENQDQEEILKEVEQDWKKSF